MFRPESLVGVSCTREKGLGWKPGISGLVCRGGGACSRMSSRPGGWLPREGIRSERQAGYGGVELGPFFSVK